MNRLQKILTGLLIVQIGLAGFILWPKSRAGGDISPLLENFDPRSVLSLVIEDNEGSLVELSRAGDSWLLSSGGNYPADGSKITPILENLAKVQTGRLVTRTDASHAPLSVAEQDFLRKITLLMLDGEKWEVFVGTTAGGNTSHVRRGDSREVFLASDLSYFSLSPQASNWIDPLYLNYSDRTLNEIVLENAQGTFRFEKNESGDWEYLDLPVGEEFAENNLKTLENSLKSLRMVQPLGEEQKPEYGLENPLARVEFSFDADGTTRTIELLIGDRPEGINGNYVIKSSESSFYVTASPGTVGTMVNRAGEDFLIPRPTATPESTSTP